MKNILLIASSLILFSACQTTDDGKSSMTPLQIQSLQTRDYPNNHNIVFRSVVSVFQDLGYTIKSADISTGFIQADGTASSNEALKVLFGATKTEQTKATGFVERIGNRTRVRLNFVHSIESSTVYGAADRKESPILDAHVYQNAFEKVDSAIFLRSSSN